MHHENFYLIEPRPEFLSRLRTLADEDLAMVLREPFLLRNPEADRSPWRPADHLLRVKLLFLAARRELGLMAPDDATRVFASSEVSERLFDQWFTVRVFGIDDNADTMEPLLRPLASSVKPTGNMLVDDWIDGLKGASRP